MASGKLFFMEALYTELLGAAGGSGVTLLLLTGFLILAGCLTGFLSGLLGIGGGLVLVPCFYFGFSALGYDSAHLMHVAVGTSLAVIAPTGMSSAWAHYKRGAFRADLWKKIAPGTFIGGLSGVYIAGIATGVEMQYIFAFAVMGAAFLMISNPAKFYSFPDVPPFYAALPVGFMIGALAALLGIGGTLLLVPFLTMSRVPIHQAVGTSSAIGLSITIPAAFGFVWIGMNEHVHLPFVIGYVQWLAWVLILPFSIFFAPIGAHVAHSVSVKKLRLFFGLFMVVVALRMMFEAFHG